MNHIYRKIKSTLGSWILILYRFSCLWERMFQKNSSFCKGQGEKKIENSLKLISKHKVETLISIKENNKERKEKKQKTLKITFFFLLCNLNLLAIFSHKKYFKKINSKYWKTFMVMSMDTSSLHHLFWAGTRYKSQAIEH